ncbi:MAG: CvpA family protein [Bacteroidaceae bacterium]|nr:CvpA family protein [Bacteroidaceae bacterium]
MTWFEILCLVLVVIGLVKGWCNGLIKELCSMVGLLLGCFIAWSYYDRFGNGLMALALVVLVPVGLSLLASLLTAIVEKLFVVGNLNRLLGALLGAGKVLLFIVFVLYLINKVQEWKAMLPDLPSL